MPTILMGLRPIAVSLVIAASAAHADYDPSAFPPYETCAVCHGLFGVSHTAKFPNLGAQRPAYIEAQIRAFLAGTRSNDGGQMSTIVTELEPEDIPVVVEWFANQDKPEPYPTDDPAPGAATFAELGCGGCHTNTEEDPPEVPYLSAQHPGYLAKQMRNFRDGERDVDALPRMHAEALTISNDQIDAIAAYLASERRP